jgi:hypothetical protein
MSDFAEKIQTRQLANLEKWVRVEKEFGIWNLEYVCVW